MNIPMKCLTLEILIFLCFNVEIYLILVIDFVVASVCVRGETENELHMVNSMEHLRNSNAPLTYEQTVIIYFLCTL